MAYPRQATSTSTSKSQSQTAATGGLLSPEVWANPRGATAFRVYRPKNDTKSQHFTSAFDRWGNPENDLPDELLWQYPDLDSVSRDFLRHGARSAAEKLAYAQQVNPLAHLDAEVASQDVQHAFQESGKLDQSQYFVGPDGRAYLRNEDSEEQPGAKIRRGYENAIGGFPTYDIKESLQQISEATRSKRTDVELYNPPTLPEQEERERFLAPFAVNPAAWQSGDRAPEDMQKIFRDAPNLWHPYPNSYLGPDGVVYEMNELTAPEPFGQFHKAREEWERQQFLRTLPPPSDEDLYWHAVESAPVLLRGRFRTAQGPQGRFIPPGGEEARAQIRARLDEIPRLAALYGLKQASQLEPAATLPVYRPPKPIGRYWGGSRGNKPTQDELEVLRQFAERTIQAIRKAGGIGSDGRPLKERYLPNAAGVMARLLGLKRIDGREKSRKIDSTMEDPKRGEFHLNTMDVDPTTLKGTPEEQAALMDIFFRTRRSTFGILKRRQLEELLRKREEDKDAENLEE